MNQGETPKDKKNDEEEIEQLSLLNQKKQNIIEKDFSSKSEDGLTLDEFVSVMLTHLDYSRSDPDQTMQITLRLIDLFREIDVNGDAHLEWQEFSNHIIELGMLKKDRTVKEVIKNYYPSDSVKNSVIKRKHDSDLEKIYYFDQIKQIIAIERDSPSFQVYTYNNPKLVCDIQGHKGPILGAEMVNVEGSNLLATTSIDLTINFWDPQQNFKLKQIISTPEIQQVLRYTNWNNTAPQLLYSGGNDAIIHVYDLKNFKEKSILTGWNPFQKKDTDQRGHSGPIMDILPIKEQNFLATAALDGKICLWDAQTEKNVKTLGGDSSHIKGITSLEWVTGYFSLLSAGLDHDVYVFNTYVKEKIFTLKGHTHPLVGVKHIPDSPQIITADISGMVKIWDVRTWLCVQTFNSPTDKDKLYTFAVTYPKKRIILGSKHMMFYDYDEPKDQALTDEKTCLRVLFNSTLQAFVTLHLDSVKIWDARNGCLLSAHRGLAKNGAELTCCCLDDRERKLFIGDSHGKISAINVKNGATLRKFERHTAKDSGNSSKEKKNKEIITDLCYFARKKLLVSSSRSNSVKIHDDSSSDPNKSRNFEMKMHKNSCNGLSIKAETSIGSMDGLVASCSDDSTVIITNLTNYRLEAQLPMEKEASQYKKLLFQNPYDAFVAVDSLGYVIFFAYSTEKKFKKVLTKEYMANSQTDANKVEQSPVTAMAFDKNNGLLLLGDEFGNIEVWDCSRFIQRVERNRVYLDSKMNKTKSNVNNINVGGANGETNKKPDQNLQESSKKIGDDNVSQRNLDDKNTFLTHTEVNDIEAFCQDDIFLHDKIKQAHNDGITWIDMISEYNAFATSSFDCCACIWSLSTLEKIGSLLLGNGSATGTSKEKENYEKKDDQKDDKKDDQKDDKKDDQKDDETKGEEEVEYQIDPNWKFRVDQDNRKVEAVKEADQLQKDIKEKKETDQQEVKKEKKDYKDQKVRMDLLINAKNNIANVKRLLNKGLSDLDSVDKVTLDDNQSNSEILFDLNDIVGSGYQGTKYKGGKKK